MRNRYLDLLRAAAILRVIVYHFFGWPWLTIVFPAMGVMFAVAGSVMAASLQARGAGRVVTSRLRRLLPPLWVFGLVAVPVMLAAGWADDDGDYPLSISRLAFWVLPIGDPVGSEWGMDLWEPLWYLRAYLWFVVLSPVLYLVYRRIGWAAVAAPLALVVVLEVTGFTLPEAADAAMWDFATYGACWIAGFAHHDGRLARIRPWPLLAIVAGLGAAAMYWLRGHPAENGTVDLNEVAQSQALWSLAFVLLVLRWQPPMGWLDRLTPLRTAVNACNARAVTIYLWHNVMIALAWPVLTWLTLDDLGLLDEPVTFALVLLLTAGAVVAFGWVEDLAARRRPRVWPGTGAADRRGAPPARDARGPAGAPVGPVRFDAGTVRPPSDGPGPAAPIRAGENHSREPTGKYR